MGYKPLLKPFTLQYLHLNFEESSLSAQPCRWVSGIYPFHGVVLVHLVGHTPTMVCAIKGSKGNRHSWACAAWMKEKNDGLICPLGTFSSFNTTSYFLANDKISRCIDNTFALHWSNRYSLFLATGPCDKNALLMQSKSCYRYRACSSELSVSLLE